MLTLPDIKRSLHSSELRRLEPPITIRKKEGRCLIQVVCPEYRPEEVAYDLDQKRILLFGKAHRDTSELPRPAHFEHSISLGFDATRARVKSVFLDGVFSILVQAALQTET